VVAGGRRARRAAAATPVAASVESRILAAAAWLFERRARVLVSAVSVATVAMIGGALAFIPFAGAPRPDSEAATIVDTGRPTPIDPTTPSSSAPVVASPGPRPSPGPTSPTSPTSPTPRPEAPAAPVTEAPVAPPADPGAAEPPPPDTAPAPPNPAETPSAPDPAQECDEQDGLLGALFGPPCP
jgi:hypothetical protein